MPVEEADHTLYRPTGRYQATFVVSTGRRPLRGPGRGGAAPGKQVRPDNEEAIRYLAERLDRLGVYAALRAQGAQPGDEVDIEGYAFEFQ